MSTEELIKLVSKSPIYSLYEAEEIIGNKAYKVSKQQDLQEYRHYAVSTDIYECDDGYVGITGPCALYNESDTWKDICCICKASEYAEKWSITYVPA